MRELCGIFLVFQNDTVQLAPLLPSNKELEEVLVLLVGEGVLGGTLCVAMYPGHEPTRDIVALHSRDCPFLHNVFTLLQNMIYNSVERQKRTPAELAAMVVEIHTS